MTEFIKHVMGKGFSIKFIPHPSDRNIMQIEYSKGFMRVTGVSVTIEFLEETMPGISNMAMMENFEAVEKVFQDGKG